MQASKPKNRQDLIFSKRYLITLARYTFLAVVGTIIAGSQRIEAAEQYESEGPGEWKMWDDKAEKKRSTVQNETLDNENLNPVHNNEGEVEHDDTKETEVTDGNDETARGPSPDNTSPQDAPPLLITAQGHNIVIELLCSGERTAYVPFLKGGPQPAALRQGIRDGLILFGTLITLFRAGLFTYGAPTSVRKGLYNRLLGMLLTPLGWTCGFLSYAFLTERIGKSRDKPLQGATEDVIFRYLFGIGYALCCVVLVTTIWDGIYALIRKQRKGDLLPYGVGSWLPSGFLCCLCYLFVHYMGYAPGDAWLFLKLHAGGLSMGKERPVLLYRGEIALAILAILVMITISPPPRTTTWKATIANTSYGLLILRGVVLAAAVVRWWKALTIIWHGPPVWVGSVTFLIINLWWWQSLYPYLAALFLARCHWLLSAAAYFLYHGLVFTMEISLLRRWKPEGMVQLFPTIFILGGFSLYLLFSIVDIIDWAGLPITAMWPTSRRKQGLSHRRAKGTSGAKTSYGNQSQQAEEKSYLGGLFNFSTESQQGSKGGSEAVTSSPVASPKLFHGLLALLLLLLLLSLLRHWMRKKA